MYEPYCIYTLYMCAVLAFCRTPVAFLLVLTVVYSRAAGLPKLEEVIQRLEDAESEIKSLKLHMKSKVRHLLSTSFHILFNKKSWKYHFT